MSFQHLKAWRCISCGQMLGTMEYDQEKRLSVRIVRNHFVVNIVNPDEVGRACHRCGLWNSIGFTEKDKRPLVIEGYGGKQEAAHGPVAMNKVEGSQDGSQRS